MMDCRQNVLTTINSLLKRMTIFQSKPDDKHLNRFLSHLINDLQLLRNDLILLFNQNFYLRCKLDQKTQELNTAEKRVAEVSSRMELALDMTKHRYEKQIQALRFAQFSKRDAEDSLPSQENCKNLTLSLKLQDLPKQLNEQKQPHCPAVTAKKLKEFQQLKATPPAKDPLFLSNLPEQREGEFDLELRGALLSEKPVFSNNRVSEEMVKSSQMEHQGKKRRGRTARKDEVLCHRKKKSQELAELVAQQFKVPPFKQKYFSTDLL